MFKTKVFWLLLILCVICANPNSLMADSGTTTAPGHDAQESPTPIGTQVTVNWSVSSNHQDTQEAYVYSFNYGTNNSGQGPALPSLITNNSLFLVSNLTAANIASLSIGTSGVSASLDTIAGIGTGILFTFPSLPTSLQFTVSGSSIVENSDANFLLVSDTNSVTNSENGYLNQSVSGVLLAPGIAAPELAVVATPEPSTFLTLGTGLFGFALWMSKRRKSTYSFTAKPQ
jgi:PEP-CTERM motif